VAASHFCITSQADTLDPFIFVRSLSHQLGRIAGFAQPLLEETLVHVAGHASAQENYGSIIGVHIENLIVQPIAATAAFNRTVVTPLKQLYAEGFDQQLVIVVDALDEAVQQQGTETIVELLANAQGLPPQIRFVLTTRPDSAALRNFEQRACHRLLLSGGYTENEQDVRTYILHQLETSHALRAQLTEHKIQAGSFINRILTASQGNFLYLIWLLPAIAEGTQQFDSLEALPQGLDGIYREFLRTRIAGKDIQVWRNNYRPLLGVLVAAQAPLTLKQMILFTGLSKQEVCDILLDVQQFLDPIQMNQDLYRLYHQSFADFLHNSRASGPEFWIDLEPIHKSIASYYKNTMHNCASIDWGGVDKYGLLHLAFHLKAASMHEDLYMLVVGDNMGSKWASTHYSVEGSYSGYLRDLDLVWRWLVSEEGWNIKRQINCALVRSSIRSHAGNIPPALLVSLVKTKLWSPQLGLSFARQMPEAEQQAKSLAIIMPYLPEALKTGVWQESLKATKKIRDERHREWVLAELLPSLAKGGFPQEALETVPLIEDEGFQAWALARLIHYVPATLLRSVAQTIGTLEYHKDQAFARLATRFMELGDFQEALATLRKMTSGYWRAQVLAGLTSNQYLPMTLVLEAFKIARAIENVRDRMLSLAGMLPHLPEELRSEILHEIVENTLAFSTPWRFLIDDRAEILSRLSPSLPEPLLLEVLERVRELEDERDLVAVLAGMASTMPEPQKENVLREALEIAKTIESDGFRAWALLEIACQLSTAQLEPLLRETLELVQALKDDGFREWALEELIPVLPEALLQQLRGEMWTIHDEENQEEALTELAPSLSSIGYQEEAINTSRIVENEEFRAFILAKSALSLPKPLLDEALSIAGKIVDGELRAAAMASLAIRLGEVDDQQKALEIVQQMDDAFWAAKTLAGLSAVLNEPWLSEVFKIATGMENEQFRALVSAPLVIRLVQLNNLPKAREILLRMADGTYKVWALVELASLQFEPLREEVFAIALEIEDIGTRVQALSKLVPFLTHPLLKQLLDVISETEDEYLRAQLVIGLAPRLTEIMDPHQAIDFVLEIEHEEFQSLALAGLVLSLAEPLKVDLAQKLLTAMQDMVEEDFLHYNAEYIARVLVRLAPALPEHLLRQALNIAQKLRDEIYRTQTLVALIPYLVDVGYPQEALEMALAIEDEEGWLKALADLFFQLSMITQENLRLLWREILQSFTLLPRQRLLKVLPFLAPISLLLDGPEAVSALYRSISEVGRQWI